MKLEIKEPYHEDWNNMKIGVKSRHCQIALKSATNNRITSDKVNQE